jgi:phosphate-selective porin
VRYRPFLVALALAVLHVPAHALSQEETVPVTIRLGGLIQAQADAGDQGDSRFPADDVRFYLRRVRLNATARFPEGFEARLEAELAGTLAGTSNLRAQLTDAYVGWTKRPALQVRAGQFKTPFGHEQLLSDLRMTTMERSLGSDRLTPGRQLGVEAHGDLLGKRLAYALGAFNGSGANTTANADGEMLVAGRVSGTPWKGTLAGSEASLSAGLGAFASDENGLSQAAEFGFDSTPDSPVADNLLAGRRRGTGGDVQLTAGRLEVLAEALLLRFEPDAGVPARSFEASSVYVQVAYEVLPKRLQLFAKVDRFDPNRDRDADATTTLSAGGSWFLRGHDLKLQANYLGSDVPGLPRQHKVLARIQAAF